MLCICCQRDSINKESEQLIQSIERERESEQLIQSVERESEQFLTMNRRTRRKEPLFAMLFGAAKAALGSEPPRHKAIAKAKQGRWVTHI